jgi:hypothetical protein
MAAAGRAVVGQLFSALGVDRGEQRHGEEGVIRIACDFPGGNVLLDSVEGDIVRLRQDQRDTRRSWFYWYFGVRGAAGRTLRFTFAEDVVGVHGPGVSLDGGTTWRWLGGGTGDRRSFTYTFPEDVAEVRFSSGMPYTQAHLGRFLAAHADAPRLRRETLCQSRKGRPVELLSCGCPEGEAQYRVLVTARHHACEMMGSYVLEGIIEAALADDETGRWLRDRVEILVVPFMDKDGVEEGDQGKGRAPHDHECDYAAGLYPEVRALKERARRWAGAGLRCMLDLHCPGKWGQWSELVHFVGIPQADLWARTEEFCRALEATNRGPLPYRTGNNLLYGVGWNTAEEWGPPTAVPDSAAVWLSQLPGVWFGAIIEVPYANAQGVEVNAQMARAFGRDLAEGLRRYLSARPPAADSGRKLQR